MTEVAGVDEVGVGAFAGPVIAAAVILAPQTVINGLADSKLLTPKRREKLFAVISARAVAIGIGRADVEEVDRLNIYWAAMEARRRAGRGTAHETSLYSGRRQAPDVGCRVPQTAIVDRDALSASIAAASIVAKVTRDSIMQEYARVYPESGFERHKGYGTMDHIHALTRLRPLPLHRWSFEPVWRAGRATTAACIVGRRERRAVQINFELFAGRASRIVAAGANRKQGFPTVELAARARRSPVAPSTVFTTPLRKIRPSKTRAVAIRSAGPYTWFGTGMWQGRRRWFAKRVLMKKVTFTSSWCLGYLSPVVIRKACVIALR